MFNGNRVSTDRAIIVRTRLLASAERLEAIAEHIELPGSSRLAYRDLAGQCRAQADSLAVAQ